MARAGDAGAPSADRFTVLRVESANESVALVGVETDEGFEFRVERCALGADVPTDAEPVYSTWVSTWREALQHLEPLEWPRMRPIEAHAAFNTLLLQALKDRTGAADTDWSRWMAVLQSSFDVSNPY